jgi:hypothetical protein
LRKPPAPARLSRRRLDWWLPEPAGAWIWRGRHQPVACPERAANVTAPAACPEPHALGPHRRHEHRHVPRLLPERGTMPRVKPLAGVGDRRDAPADAVFVPTFLFRPLSARTAASISGDSVDEGMVRLSRPRMEREASDGEGGRAGVVDEVDCADEGRGEEEDGGAGAACSRRGGGGGAGSGAGRRGPGPWAPE